jgi:hypothetical protein
MEKKIKNKNKTNIEKNNNKKNIKKIKWKKKN